MRGRCRLFYQCVRSQKRSSLTLAPCLNSVNLSHVLFLCISKDVSGAPHIEEFYSQVVATHVLILIALQLFLVTFFGLFSDFFFWSTFSGLSQESTSFLHVQTGTSFGKWNCVVPICFSAQLNCYLVIDNSIMEIAVLLPGKHGCTNSDTNILSKCCIRFVAGWHLRTGFCCFVF